jgi:hypothetical protein
MPATPLPPEMPAELRPAWDILRDALRHARSTRDYRPASLHRPTADFARAARQLSVAPEALLVVLKRMAVEEGLEGPSDRWREVLVARLVRWGIESYYAKSASEDEMESRGGRFREAKVPAEAPGLERFAADLVRALHAHVNRSDSADDLPTAVRQIARFARASDVPIEQLIVLFKALCDRLLSATPATRSGRERTRARDRMVSLLIKDYYGGDHNRVVPEARDQLGAADDVATRDL